MKRFLSVVQNHIQMITGFLVFALTTIDFAGLAGPMKDVFGLVWGPRVYYATIALSALTTMVRAYQAKRATPIPAPT